ncbi:hypothetical protein ACFE04_028368 [Oxalis oulophora]
MVKLGGSQILEKEVELQKRRLSFVNGTWVEQGRGRTLRRAKTRASLAYSRARRRPNFEEAELGIWRALQKTIFVVGQAWRLAEQGRGQACLSFYNQACLTQYGPSPFAHIFSSSLEISFPLGFMNGEKKRRKDFPLSALPDHLSMSKTMDEIVPIVRDQIEEDVFAPTAPTRMDRVCLVQDE